MNVLLTIYVDKSRCLLTSRVTVFSCLHVLKDLKTGRVSSHTRETLYGKIFEEMYCPNGIVLKGIKIVVPPRLVDRMLKFSTESHRLGVSKTLTYLRERVCWSGMHVDINRYIDSCYACSFSVPTNAPPSITNTPLPSGPSNTVALDFKGPIESNHGFYFYVAIVTYSRYPDVTVVPDTKFSILKAALEET